MIKPLGILVEMFVQDEVGHDFWGKYAALYSLCHLFSTFADLGLNQLLTKEIASNKEAQDEVSRNVLGLKIISSILFPFLMVAIGNFLAYEFVWLKFLFIIASTHSLIQFFGFYRAQIQGNQLYFIDSIGSNLDKFLLIIITLGLITFNLSDWTYTFGRAISIAISCLIIFFICYKYKLIFKPSLNFTILKPILKKSIPFAFITLVYGINEQVDQVMVERLTMRFTDFNHSAIYSAAYRLVNAIMMYLWIVLPMFFAKFTFHETDQKLKEKLIQTGTSLIYLPVAFVALFSIFHSKLLFFVFKKSTLLEVTAMSDIFSILSYTLLLQGFFAILSTFLTANGYEKFVTKLVLISVFFNIVSNLAFIPLYGAYAAAWTTFGSGIIVVVGYIWKIKANHLIDLPYRSWIKLFIVTFLTYLAYFIGSFYSDILSITLGITTFSLSLLIIKPIALKDLKNIT